MIEKYCEWSCSGLENNFTSPRIISSYVSVLIVWLYDSVGSAVIYEYDTKCDWVWFS
jgi:hypothetical protein